MPNGMLELVLPLAEGSKPHRITFKTSSESHRLHAA